MIKGTIIGFGGQGKQLFLAMRKLDINVVAVCDTNSAVFKPQPQIRESWANSFPALADCGTLPPRIYNDWRQCLQEQRDNLDIVAVATWTKDHSPVAVMAAEMGARKIICEEPMADCLDDARRIIDACKENNVFLTVHHTRRWWPAHQLVRQWIEEGKIGDLRHIWISCGGARLGDLGTHWIDWARWIANRKAISVTGHLWRIEETNPRGEQFHDYPGHIDILFENRVTATINEGPNIALPPRYEIVGTRGRIRNDQIGDCEHWVVETRPEDTPLSAVRDYYGQLKQIDFPMNTEINWKEAGVNAIKELIAGRPSCDENEGYKTLEILVATHISDSNRRPVRLPITKPSYLQLKLENA